MCAALKREVGYFERSRGCFVVFAGGTSDGFAHYEADVERGQVIGRDGASYRFSGPPPRRWNIRLDAPRSAGDCSQVKRALESLIRPFGGRVSLNYSAVVSNRITAGAMLPSPPRQTSAWSLTGWLSPACGAPLFPLGWSGRGCALGWLNGGCAEELRGLDAALGHAEPVEPGGVAAVLSPAASAVLIHEVIGHTVEAPLAAGGGNLIGRRIASDALTVSDDPLAPGGPVEYEYDDEGVRSPGATAVVREGVLTAQLHSQESAGRAGTLSTANGRAASAWDKPIPRVSNLVCRPGSATEDEMIAGVARGLYVHRLANGINDGAFVNAQVTLAELIDDGKRTGRFLTDGRIRERIGEPLLRIAAVGGATRFHANSICGRAGQLLFNVGTCAPALSLSGLRITA